MLPNNIRMVVDDLGNRLPYTNILSYGHSLEDAIKNEALQAVAYENMALLTSIDQRLQSIEKTLKELNLRVLNLETKPEKTEDVTGDKSEDKSDGKDDLFNDLFSYFIEM